MKSRNNGQSREADMFYLSLCTLKKQRQNTKLTFILGTANKAFLRVQRRTLIHVKSLHEYVSTALVILMTYVQTISTKIERKHLLTCLKAREHC